MNYATKLLAIIASAVLFLPMSATAQTDNTRPSCEIQSLDPGPPTTLTIVVGDADSGLKKINVLVKENANVSIEAFAPGDTDPKTVTASRIHESQRSTVIIKVVDMAGNATICDPVVTNLVSETPEGFSLGSNYPNPFNPTTTFTVGLPEESHVRIAVYDIMGRHVTTLVDGVMSPGRHEVTWEARDESGRELSSGTYLYRMDAGSFVEQSTMVLLR